MLTINQMRAREGYYFDTETGDILRILGGTTVPTENDDAPRFALLTDDVERPFEDVHQLARARFGERVTGRFVNRQTAAQPNEQSVTEETTSNHLSGEKSMVTDPVCGMTIDAKTAYGSRAYAGRTYFFCSAQCQQKFDQDPAQYAATTDDE